MITSSSQLRNDQDKVKRTMSTKHSHRLLVIVCEKADDSNRENDKYYVSFIPSAPISDSGEKKKVVVIASKCVDGLAIVRINDKVLYEQTSAQFQQKILSTSINFQGSESTVGELIGDIQKAGEITDSVDVMQELSSSSRIAVEILSFSCSRFERSLYIKRRRTLFPCPIDEQFWDEVAKALADVYYNAEKLKQICRVNTEGEIQWLIQDHDEISKIWDKMNFVLDKKRNKSMAHQQPCLQEKDLILRQAAATGSSNDNSRQLLSIISGVAGTGKSTLLSQLYEEIKATKGKDYWVVRVNLTDHQKLFQMLQRESAEVNVIHFLVSLPAVIGQSSFSRSLLRTD